MKHLDSPDGFVRPVPRVAAVPGNRRRRLARPAQALALGWLLLLGGCGGCGGSDLPSVSGTVKLNGQPLTGGKLVFQPTGHGAQGYASIRADGTYEVRTGRQEGLAEGSYIVTVHANAADGASRIPPRYTDSTQSDQKITVVAGDNPYDIDIVP